SYTSARGLRIVTQRRISLVSAIGSSAAARAPVAAARAIRGATGVPRAGSRLGCALVGGFGLLRFFSRPVLAVLLPQLTELARVLGERLIVPAQDVELGLRELLHRHELVARSRERRRDLVELELDRERVLALRALDQEHHEEGHDRRPGVDYALP